MLHEKGGAGHAMAQSRVLKSLTTEWSRNKMSLCAPLCRDAIMLNVLTILKVPQGQSVRSLQDDGRFKKNS